MDKNYITPGGMRRLVQELKILKNEERPAVTETVAWAAANGDRSENGDYIYGKKRLREIDRRIRFLNKQIEAAEVIDPVSVDSDIIQFGATFTILDEDDRERTYTIVGVDEADAGNGLISWRSPLARAVLKKKKGDIVEFVSPKGEQSIEILDFKYTEVLRKN